MILLVGSEGAQGKRYQAILRYLGQEYFGIDVKRPTPDYDTKTVTGVILATPTGHHIFDAFTYAKLGVPLLVEKPFSTDVAALKSLAPEMAGVSVSMVMQYRHLLDQKSSGSSHYDYFRHGSDGLVWDCLQTIAFAKSDVRLAEASPVWDCAINGHKLNIADMDAAYVREIKDWLSGRHQSFSEIIDIHEKVKAYAARS